MPSGKTQVAATVAVLALGVGSVSAVPTYRDYLVARNPASDIPKTIAKEVGGGYIQSVGTAAVQKVAGSLLPKQPTDPRSAQITNQLIGQATGPHNPAIVNAVINNPHLKKDEKAKKKRALLEYFLAQRDFEDDELFVRNPIRVAGKVVTDIAQSVGTDALHKKAKEVLTPQKPVDPRTAKMINDGVSKAQGPFNPKLVDAVVNNPHLHKKRSPYEYVFEERDFEDDRLFTRNPLRVAGKVVTDVAQSVGTDALHKKAKEYMTPQKPTDPRSAKLVNDAVSKAQGPYNPSLVNSVVNNPHVHKKRDLYEYLFEERDFEDDELFVRNPLRVAGKVVTDVAQSVGTDALHKKAKEYLTPQKPVDPRTAKMINDGVSKAQGPFNPSAVNSVVNNPHMPHKKRALDILIDELVARAMELDELD